MLSTVLSCLISGSNRAKSLVRSQKRTGTISKDDGTNKNCPKCLIWVLAFSVKVFPIIEENEIIETARKDSMLAALLTVK